MICTIRGKGNYYWRGDCSSITPNINITKCFKSIFNNAITEIIGICAILCAGLQLISASSLDMDALAFLVDSVSALEYLATLALMQEVWLVMNPFHLSDISKLTGENQSRQFHWTWINSEVFFANFLLSIDNWFGNDCCIYIGRE